MLRPDDFYYLLQAYDLLGRRLHGEEWTGQEFREIEIASPEEVAETRARLDGGVARLDERQGQIEEEISGIIDAAKIAALKEELGALIKEREPLRMELFNLPYDPKDHQRQWKSWQRRRTTEEELIGAFRTERLQAQFVGGSIIDWASWERDRCFRYSLELSMVFPPRYRAGRRRGSVLIKKDAFQAWLKTVIPVNAGELAKLSPEEQCRAWLVKRFSGKRTPKPVVWDEAMKLFPGLSKRAFDRLWQAHAPSEWKRSGRPNSERN